MSWVRRVTWSAVDLSTAADYLKALDANDALYNEYFRWKAKYLCEIKPFNNGCNLCRHALAKRGQKELVTDLVAEWGRAQNCIDATQFYRGHGLSVWELARGECVLGNYQNIPSPKKLRAIIDHHVCVISILFTINIVLSQVNVCDLLYVSVNRGLHIFLPIK